MGLGKTAIALDALATLGPKRTLVVAPAKVVERGVWELEAQEWEHTQGWKVLPLLGNPATRRKVMDHGADVEVVSYDNLRWLLEERAPSYYDAVVYDELSKLKSCSSGRFKAIRYQLAEVPIRFGLTGSPVGNHLLDLWAEMFAVAGEAPLGPSFSKYREQYFVPVNPYAPRHMMTWELRRAEDEAKIHERIRPHAYSFDGRLSEGMLPELRVSEVFEELPAAVRKLGDDLTEKCVAELESGVSLTALNGSAVSAKLRQLASGAVYLNPLDETKPWERVHEIKIKMLEEVLEEQQGAPVLCFYWYKHELARLKRAFPFAKTTDDAGALEAWDRGEVPLLLAHPASAGHGLNLQKGGSTVVWFALPWSHELWEQGNGRLVRRGQASSWVGAIVLLVGEMDQYVAQVLRAKGEVQDRLAAAVRVLDPDDPMLQ